ncbi:hypothetical protein [Phragmitibacter flavus]|uniref:hypothetical protein n=1 Tax=Phragmitibacter flavus TaxID=2576071 RepID=UPI001F0D2C19|nr:hypothetical protein [Phragmitibacter flavus]
MALPILAETAFASSRAAGSISAFTVLMEMLSARHAASHVGLDVLDVMFFIFMMFVLR